MIEANAELQKLYLRLRNRYWIRQGKALPGLDRVMVQYVNLHETLGRHIFDPNPDNDFPDFLSYIPISRSLRNDPEELEATLFHEMCHLATARKEKESHGPLWKAEMIRLLRMGAQVLWDEL